MSADDGERRLREVEIDLAGHLQECSVRGQMVWDELKSQRKLLWAIVAGIIATLMTVCGVLLKGHLHL